MYGRIWVRLKDPKTIVRYVKTMVGVKGFEEFIRMHLLQA